MRYKAIDLHLHSNASDGTLSPRELVTFAATRCAIDCLALTDHDTLLGIPEAAATAKELGIGFISGIEFSSDFAGVCIHVVGLGVDMGSRILQEECQLQSARRKTRSIQMDKRLEDLGFPGTGKIAYRLAANKDNVSRSHFARALIEVGAVAHEQEAFDRFIGPNQPGYVAVDWPSLAVAVDLLHKAGALAVLAHPGRYCFQNEWERFELVKAFKASGGDGIEITSGSQPEAFTARCLQWARDLGLLASTGSDFHRFEGSRPLPGTQPALPEGIATVLERLVDQ